MRFMLKGLRGASSSENWNFEVELKEELELEVIGVAWGRKQGPVLLDGYFMTVVVPDFSYIRKMLRIAERYGYNAVVIKPFYYNRDEYIITEDYERYTDFNMSIEFIEEY